MKILDERKRRDFSPDYPVLPSGIPKSVEVILRDGQCALEADESTLKCEINAHLNTEFNSVLKYALRMRLSPKLTPIN